MRTEKNLKAHELIGLQARVKSSSCRKLAGLAGKVVWETMNTLHLESGSGVRKVPKRATIFVFSIEGGKNVEVSGDEIRFRPQDRTKKVL
jgi:ribonuclease P protein subunit POP4